MPNSDVISNLIALSIALLIVGPLAWKWQLGLGRCAVFVVFSACSFGATTAILMPRSFSGKPVQVIAIVILTVLASLAVLLFRFYRDPERTTTKAEGTIVSPADGRIIYVYRSERSLLPVSSKHGRRYALHELTRTSLQHEDSIVVGIAMNYLDVHVNRAPVSGTIVLRRHFPGRFGSLRDPAMVFENERATTVIRSGELEVAVVQIASRLVRQIVSFVNPGQAVVAGERIGVIRLGSQVDLVIPLRPDLMLHAKVGDQVVAGESIIGVFAGAATLAAAPGSPIEENAKR
jgi:phosphatidylserine decarboxylase